MNSSLKRLPGNTLEITVTVPWFQIESIYTKIFAAVLAEIELPGFRKGKAPHEIASKHVSKTHVFEEVLKEIVPHIYADLVKEHEIKPIISPKVEVLEANENIDWKLLVKTCEKPTINLGSYRTAIDKLKADKGTKIWLQGEKKETAEKKEDVKLAELLEVLNQEIKVDLSELLLETETNRLLSNLVQELQKLGLTVEQYLQSQGKTSETLREEYSKQARKTLSLEFALEEIAEKERITVEPAEIQAFINQAKTDAEKKQLEREQYYIGSLLRRQKTLNSLLKPSLVTA